MIKRYVIEGAPGAGKTTIIFGRSHDEDDKTHYPCLKDEGFNVISESMTGTNRELRKEGIEPKYNMPEVFKRVLKKTIDKFHNVKEGINIFDRGLPSYEPLGNFFKGMLDMDNFYENCKKIRYDSPIIFLKPIPSVDLSKPKIPGKITTRIYSLEERYDLHEQIKETYKKQGYEVIEIPIYSDNLEENLKIRIKKILKIIKFYNPLL